MDEFVFRVASQGAWTHNTGVKLRLFTRNA